MSAGDLLPCPFCGGANLRFTHVDIDGWIAHVDCIDCDDMIGPMSSYKYDTKAEAEADAAAVWNRRAPAHAQGWQAKAASEAIRDLDDATFDAALKAAGLSHKKAMAFLRAIGELAPAAPSQAQGV